MAARGWPNPVGAAAARVLVIDDSVVARTVIARIVDGHPGFVTAGQVGSAAAAMEFLLRERVDFILLDLAMPGLDGLTALPGIASIAQGARIVVVSSSAAAGAAATIRALALGAADTLEKPAASDMSGAFARLLMERLERLAAGRRHGLALAHLPQRTANAPAAFDVVAIGASTGGIHALSGVLQPLPPAFDVPIIITQHLPATFIPYFATQVAGMAGRPCVIATDLMRLRPGQIVVAPGTAHIRCIPLSDGQSAIRLTREAVPSGCMPSVDPMFTSAAEVFGARMLAIVLSGMGRDGVTGARAVRQAGGCVMVQDEASSVVWGMPGAVVAQGLADAVLPPEAIGQLMVLGRRI